MLKKIIKEDLSTILGKVNAVRIYLFGSAVCKSNPNDIDILIVYDRKNSIREIINFSNEINKIINSKYQKPAHITILNIEEEKEVSFISDTNAILIAEY